MCALYVHKHLRENGEEKPIALTFTLAVQKLFDLSTISWEGLMVNALRGIHLSIEARNRMFCRKRIFKITKKEMHEIAFQRM